MIKTRTSGIQVARESASPVYFPLHFPRPLPMISSQSVQPCTSGTNLFGRNIWPSAAIFSFLIPWRFSRAGRARADISQHGKRQLRSERIGGGGSICRSKEQRFIRSKLPSSSRFLLQLVTLVAISAVECAFIDISICHYGKSVSLPRLGVQAALIFFSLGNRILKVLSPR